MKILLLEHPRIISAERCNDIANAPLAACLLSGYAASVLENKGHEVMIVEGYLGKLSYKKIKEFIIDFKPDLIGVHIVYHWKSDEELYKFLEEVKNENLTSFITAYGYYSTFGYEEILESSSAIDAIILGEVEMTILDLADAVSSNSSIKNVKGIAHREEGNIVTSRRDLIKDLDTLPFPTRTKGSLSIGEVNILGSRGCYGSCTFCYINSFYGCGSKWRGRSPENITKEIDEIIQKYNMRYFYFTDPNFFGPGKRGQERALKLATLLKPKNIEFGIEARVNDVHSETISRLVDAGLRHILIGLESGRDESLKRLNKLTTVAQNENALKIVRENGIEPNIGFIMFEPDSSLEDLRTNLNFLKRNKILERLEITVNVLYHHQIILQGTKAYKMLKEAGRLEISHHSKYEASTPYVNSHVKDLANIMRDITNHIFNVMEGIWSGKAPEPKDSSVVYKKINDILVESFENALTVMEKGNYFSKEDIENFVQEAKKSINVILK